MTDPPAPVTASFICECDHPEHEPFNCRYPVVVAIDSIRGEVLDECKCDLGRLTLHEGEDAA